MDDNHMIAVDTSVWIEYFRGARRDIVERLNLAFDGEEVVIPFPVWIELLSGATGAKQRQLKRVLSALPCLRPEPACYDWIDTWVKSAGERGQRFGFADLLIAAVCRLNNCSLWSLDLDFKRMERLGMISRFDP